MAFSKQTFKGAGRIFARVSGTTGAMFDLGNITQLDETTERSESSIPNLRTTAGGDWDSISRVTSMGIEFTTSDFTTLANNISRLTTSAAVASATLTDEALGDAVLGGLIPFANAMTSVSEVAAVNGDGAAAWAATTAYSLNAYRQPTVANTFYYKATTAGTSAASEPTWPVTVGATVVDGSVTWTCMGHIILTAGTDYEFTNAGIIFESSASLTVGEPLKYTGVRPAQVAHSPLTGDAQNYELLFEGLNAASTSRPAPRRYYNVKLFPSESLSLLSEDEFAQVTIPGKVLPNAAGEYGLFSYVGGA